MHHTGMDMDHGHMGHGGMDHGGMDMGGQCKMNVSEVFSQIHLIPMSYITTVTFNSYFI